MAYTDITSQLLNNQYAFVDGVAYVSKSNSYNSSYGFAASAYYGTTWFASQNLGVHSSAASIKFDISPVDSVKGVNVSISYIIDSEKNCDIGFFGKSGATLDTGTTSTGSSEVYAHTYGQNGSTTIRDVTYFIQNASSIQIIYKKDSSANSGLDRLFFTISVELGSGTGGGGDPTTTYYWMVGTRILPVGKRTTSDNSYTLPSTALTSFTAHLEAYAGGFAGANMAIVTSGNYRILWASGSAATNIWQQTMGTNPYTTDLPYTLGGVFGHSDLGVHTFSSKIYTGTTAQLYNPTSVFGSFNNTATFEQCRYNVIVESDKNTLKKAYYDVTFGSPFNETYQTGKNGYVLMISSAANSSVSITVSRTGSGSKSGTLTRPSDGNELTLSPTSNSDKICTVDDLAEFDVSAARAISTNVNLCVKYDSSIHDTGYSGTYKLMHIHEFLYFTGTPSYFKDDMQDGGSTPTPTGYVVNADVMSMSWTNAGPSDLVVQSLIIYAGVGSIANDDVLYNLLQPKTLTAGSSGSFTVPVVFDSVENVTYLTVSITCANYASLTISLNTQSHGALYFDLLPGSGTATKQVAVTNNITITGGSLSCTYASG